MVRILDNLQPRVHPHGSPAYLSNEAELIIGDVTNRSDMARALVGVDYVTFRARTTRTGYPTFRLSSTLTRRAAH